MIQVQTLVMVAVYIQNMAVQMKMQQIIIFHKFHEQLKLNTLLVSTEKQGILIEETLVCCQKPLVVESY